MAGKGLAGLLALLLFLILAGGGIFAALNPDRVQCLFADADAVEQCDFKQTDDAPAVDDVASAEPAEAVLEAPAYVLPPVEEMLRERILGFANAPIKITEHSSLTCSHCGNFHRNTYEQIKRDYIANGKAYLVFSDFPLNGPALYASMVSRCVPEENYFDFVQELFEKQEDWAYDVSYLDFLKDRAAENGLPNEQFSQCLKNDELRQGLLAKMAETQANSEVKSTPTFVINDKDIIAGSVSFDTFKSKFDGLLNPSVEEQLENAVRDVTVPSAPVELNIPKVEMPEISIPEAPVVEELPLLVVPAAPAVPPAAE
jgi:protein-disulfide isomerase